VIPVTHRIVRAALGLAAAGALVAPALQARAEARCATVQQCIEQWQAAIHEATCVTPLCSKSGS
jgi:hypothetical protein